jgi:hypothetical protein
MAQYAFTFTSGDTVTPTKLNDARTVSNIVNADINSAAAIAGTKIAPDFGSQNVVTSGDISVISSSSASLRSFRASTDNGGPQLQLSKARGTPESRVAVSSGDNIGTMLWEAHDGTGFISAAFIRAQVDSTPGTNDMPGRLIFATTADNASSPSERMRITNAGNIGINNTSPTEKLDVTGNIKVSGTAEFGGQVRVPFGTSATPGLSFDGDNDTGLIRPGSNELSFVTGGSQAMRINASNNVGIGVISIDSSCLLQLASTTKGFRPPVMSTSQRNSISSPATGLIVYNTTTDKINFYNGTSWQAVTSS